MSGLTPEGERLRQIICEAGCEITPDELIASLDEAVERITPPGCRICLDPEAETRFGVCFDCATACEEAAIESGRLGESEGTP